MQSLRALPLLRPSRSSSTDPTQPPGSRTASPAPPSTTTATANGLSTLNPAYAQDDRTSRLNERSVSAGGHPRSKSLTRPLAGLAGLSLGGQSTNGNGTATPVPSVPATANPMLNGKTGTSPPTSRSATPLPAVAPAHPSEGATIDAIGLRLNEIVNRCLLGVDPKALKGIRKGAGWGLGEAVVKYVQNFCGHETRMWLNVFA
jgi:hypothetical protein